MKDSKLKRLLVRCYEYLYEQRRIIILRVKYRLPIMSSMRTLKYIQREKCSISRFGDGEFKLAMKTAEIGFQKQNDQLSMKLMEVLETPVNNLLVCIPSTMNSVRECNAFAHNYWIEWGREKNNHINIVNMIRNKRPKYIFGDSIVTRTYIDWKTDRRAKQLYPELKKLWDGEDLLFVEGSQTRLGIGNDLFSNAKSIQRILAPAENAFDKYEDILSSAQKYGTGKMIIIALGPTATVLAYDLAKTGYRALDVGHIDIEYEWFLKRAKGRVAIPGKYTNEAKIGDGRKVADCEDEIYLSQVVDRIGC